VAAHYATFGDFARFVEKTMYYFAAASYAEMARRLERPHLSPGFLRAFDPEFCAAFRTDASIATWNIAGLADATKRNWYGVDLSDVVRGAEKLGFTRAEMAQILTTAPWAQM
jgi:hypothetical protein